MGRAFDFSRDCFGYQSPGFEIQRAARFLAGCRNVSSFLNTTSRYIQSQNLRRIDVKANLSDVNLYLDNAMLQDGHATIKVDVSLGDVNIYVPRSWEVNNSVDAFLADVKFVGMPSGEGTQNLKVEGSIRLGDVKVHYV